MIIFVLQQLEEKRATIEELERATWEPEEEEAVVPKKRRGASHG